MGIYLETKFYNVLFDGLLLANRRCGVKSGSTQMTSVGVTYTECETTLFGRRSLY